MKKWQIHLIVIVQTPAWSHLCTDSGDTSGKYATGVNDTGGDLPPVSNDTLAVDSENNNRLPTL